MNRFLADRGRGAYAMDANCTQANPILSLVSLIPLLWPPHSYLTLIALIPLKVLHVIVYFQADRALAAAGL